MLTADEFLSHFRRQRRWTRRLVEAVPASRFDWAPADDAFRAGDLVRHLIQAEIFWVRLVVRAAAGEPWDPFGLSGDPAERLEAFRSRNLEASRDGSLGESFAECLERWRTVQERSESELGRLSDAALARRAVHPLTGLEAPLWEFLLVMLAHESHHRGQLSAYLKVLGVPQPAALWS